MEYLANLMQGVVEIVRSAHGLDQQCPFQYCHVPPHIRSQLPRELPDPGAAQDQRPGTCADCTTPTNRTQLAELVKVDGYDQSMEVITTFTVHSLEQWYWSPNRSRSVIAPALIIAACTTY